MLANLLVPGTPADIADGYASLEERSRDATFARDVPDVIVLDTETTGFSPERDSLIEVAAARMRGTEIVDELDTFVNPGCHISSVISELTNITDADVQDAPDASEVMEMLADFAGDCKVIAHNAPFDQGFILANAPLSRAGDATPLFSEFPWIDTLPLARLALPRLTEYNMESLSAAFAPTSRSTHRAIDDVRALCHVWRVLLVALSDLPEGLCGYMSRMSPDVPWGLREVLQVLARYQYSTKVIDIGEKTDTLTNTAPSFSLGDARSARLSKLAKQNKTDAIEQDGGAAADVQALSRDEIEDAFSADGLAGAMYASYEPRASQVDMALEIGAAYNTSTHRVIEAGTGVGKSMAYLVPQALFAKRNHVTCGVATKTNTLLDQLVYHELPRLDKALREHTGASDDAPGDAPGLQYVALKGYDHYPCLRKLMRLANSERSYDDAEPLDIISRLLAFVCQSDVSDMDSMSIHWSGISRFEVAANADDCMHYKCRYYRYCLLHGARAQASNADIVVTNHALMFCDMMADRAILPPIRHWVVDEAHDAEEEARSQMSLTVDRRSVNAALDGLLHSGGVLSTLKKMALGLDGGTLLVGLISKAQEDAAAIDAVATSFFSYVKELADADNGGYNRMTLWLGPQVRASETWGQVASCGIALTKRLEELWKNSKDIMNTCSQYSELAEQMGDLTGCVGQLRSALDALVIILDGEDKDYVTYADVDKRDNIKSDKLVASRVDVGGELDEMFYEEMASVVFTSATLTTKGGGDSYAQANADASFDYFARAVGLDRLSRMRWKALSLTSGYDYDNNMTVYLPSDICTPQDRGYVKDLEEMLYKVHVAMGGSVLTLFTNRRQMEEVHAALEPRLKERGIELRCQRGNKANAQLRNAFLENKSLSLFATKSFWEGFDAPGDTLRAVVICKLPFANPGNPLQKERELREGRSAWKRYVLPDAVIALKQAAGRLIRTSTDRGCLVLADTRLQTKWYGGEFLNALPTRAHHVLTIDDMVKDMARFKEDLS
jgi:ATP-dependent DNA helicase DinG